MKRIISAAWAGIRISAPMFLIMCIIFGLIGGTEKFASGYGMVRSCAAAFIIGIGFGIPSLIYETNLAVWLKTLIHMGTGCIVMIGASMLGGWINAGMGAQAIVIALIAQIGIAFIIWGMHIMHTRALAKRMSAKIHEKDAEAE